MEAVFIYIAKASGLIALFYFAYYFLLRKETFFNSNRWFLLAGLITASLLPFLVYTKTVWINASPILNQNLSGTNFVVIPAKESFEISWNMVFIGIYILGVLSLLAKFAFDFYSLNSIIKGTKIKQQADFKFIDVTENIAPFSYFEYIVYNSSMFTDSELESIIEHEKVHSDQNHTVDVLISRAFCILFWFNPIIWFYKKAIVQNLEFIADKEAAQKLADKKAYQYTLLKITTHESCVAITNHFYQSLIKKRIVMLNKNQSKRRNSWKYYTIIPALVAFVLVFQVKVIAKEKQQETKNLSQKVDAIDVYSITKKSTDADLKEITENLKKDHGIDATLSEVKRNADNEITGIKVELTKGEQLSKAFMVNGSNAIQDCGIVVTTNSDGTKKINFNTSKTGDSIIASEDKLEVKTSTNSKANKNVKTNHYTVTSSDARTAGDNTKVNTNVNTSVNTSVNTKVNTNVSTSTMLVLTTDEKKGSNVVISTNSQPNVRITSDQKIIIDGVEVTDFTNLDLQKLKIKSMEMYTGDNAVSKYGEDAKKGVIIIETKK
ncbi:M56 family metallopeptidase [Flavobacterium mesophilum]|uniref:M56 family metallopeptidase n=1 Tax=Flavobacterium mesophilum TaxID=3143495 RepID=UPI0031CF981E